MPGQFIDFHAGDAPEPDWSEVDADAWRVAIEEARALELGTETAADAIDAAIDRLKARYDDTILIGGPPCQAYSLVGRARSRGKVGYVPEDDERHYLFREYIRVLNELRPAAFVMENVKGMLSSTVESRLVFEMLMEDLSSLGTGHGYKYELRAIRIQDGKACLQEAMRPSDFIVRAEAFGIPQKRHRVIIIGIRSDLADRAARAEVAVAGNARTVGRTILTLPALRSGISRGGDDVSVWRQEVVQAAELLAELTKGKDDVRLHEAFASLIERLHGVDGSHWSRPVGDGDAYVVDAPAYLEEPAARLRITQIDVGTDLAKRTAISCTRSMELVRPHPPSAAQTAGAGHQVPAIFRRQVL